jgi:hypothetical protein
MNPLNNQVNRCFKLLIVSTLLRGGDMWRATCKHALASSSIAIGLGSLINGDVGHLATKACLFSWWPVAGTDLF